MYCSDYEPKDPDYIFPPSLCPGDDQVGGGGASHASPEHRVGLRRMPLKPPVHPSRLKASSRLMHLCYSAIPEFRPYSASNSGSGGLPWHWTSGSSWLLDSPVPVVRVPREPPLDCFNHYIHPWSHIWPDFVTGLPPSDGNTTILTVVLF